MYMNWYPMFISTFAVDLDQLVTLAMFKLPNYLNVQNG